MARCFCEYLGPLQEPAHLAHTRVEQHLARIAALVPQYLAAVHRRPSLDAEQDPLLVEARARARILDRALERLLGPADATVPRRGRQSRGEDPVTINRRTKDHGHK